MNNNIGVWLFFGLFCVWPVIGYFLITYAIRFVTSRDWSNVHLSDLKLPWSKHE